MPSQEELARVVQEMRAQGLSDKEIEETLMDMGVPEGTVRSLLSPTSTPPPAEEKEMLPDDSLFATPPQEKVSPEKSVRAPSLPSPSSASSDDLFGSDVLSSLMAASPSKGKTPSPSPSVPAPPSAEEKPAPFEANIAAPPILEESVPSEKLDQIHSKVDELHRTLSSAPIRDDLAEIKEMLRELKRDLSEVRSMFSAMQKILQEILDTDRSILVDLYERAKK